MIADDKNFRLSKAIRPTRYDVELTLDTGAKRFSGKATLDLAQAEPAERVFLHAVDLNLARASVLIGSTEHQASVTPLPISQTVCLQFPEPLPVGSVSLRIEWSGAFCEGLRGLYEAGPLIVTQFEAADARRVFPCFDEPSFKAPWRIVVRVPAGRDVLSNGSLVRELEEGSQRVLEFRETPPLPTYLIALVCGKLQGSRAATVCGVPVRTWAVPEKVHLTRFGQEVAEAVLPRLEEYFGVPYAFAKLDQVAVPDFEAGAMENAGLVTYREVALLLDPKTASLATQKRVAEVITHELGHQWFGNWVTMAWWDDLWLNEAFATWIAYKIVDQWRPEWRLWLDFDVGKAEALALDALTSTHPIRAEVPNVEVAGESFDAITYEKGGAVLRMIEGYLGEAPFRAGIGQYMRKHAQKNATADDLWRALEAASSEPVLELAGAWISQPGYPLVEVSRQGRAVTLSQTRFFSEPGRSSGEIYPVPLVLRYQDEKQVTEQRFMLRERQAKVTLEGQGEVRWLCANGGAMGFYRVAYGDREMQEIARHPGQLGPAERVELLADAWALVRNGRNSIRQFLELVLHFDDEQDEAVLSELVSRLATIEHRLVSDVDRPRVRVFTERILGPGIERTGWDPAPDEPDEIRLRRAALARGLAGVARSVRAQSELIRRLDRFLTGDLGALEPNLHDIAVHVAARVGDRARFEDFSARFRSEKDPVFRRRYLLGLAVFEDRRLADRAQDLALDDFVPTQDFSSFVATLLANPIARESFWTRLRGEWERVLEKLSGAPALLRRVIEAVACLPERRFYDEARAFLAEHPVESAKQATAQTLERMAQQVELRERTQPEIGAWLTREEE